MYGRRLDDRVVEFGHEGILYRDSFVMYDRGTESLWVHTTGECVKGELRGRRLRFIPSSITTWAAWKSAHPATVVLEGELDRGFMGTYALSERRAHDFGVSVGQGDAVKLYPVPLLLERRVVHDRFEGEDIVVFFDGASLTGTAWFCGDARFSWDGEQIVDARARAWNVLLGRPAGADGDGLTPLPATTWLVERWRDFYPGSPVLGD